MAGGVRAATAGTVQPEQPAPSGSARPPTTDPAPGDRIERDQRPVAEKASVPRGASSALSAPTQARVDPARTARANRVLELASYFGVADLPRLDAALAPSGVDLAHGMAQYRDYIELILTPDADPTGRASRLIANVRHLIGQRVREATSGILEGSSSAPANKWLVNERLRTALADVEIPLLASAKLYIALTTDPDYRASVEELPAYRQDPLLRAYVTSFIANVDQELIDRQPSEIPTGLLGNPSFFDPNKRDKLLYARLLRGHGDALVEFAPGREGSRLGTPTFLSAGDSDIDTRAKLTVLAGYLLQATPYAGAVPSAIVDAQDIFSSSDTTVEYLKRAGLVPADYAVDKGMLDHVLPALGLAGSLLGLQAAGRARKLAKLRDELGAVDPTALSRAMDTLRERLAPASPELRAARSTVASFTAEAARAIDWDRVDALQATMLPHHRAVEELAASLSRKQVSALTNGNIPPEIATRLAEVTHAHATQASVVLREMGFDTQVIHVGSAGGYGVRVSQSGNRLWQRLRNSVRLQDAGIVYAPFLLRAGGGSMAKVGRDVVLGELARFEALARGQYDVSLRHELQHLRLDADLRAGRVTPFQASIRPSKPGDSLGLDIYDHHLSLEEISTYYRDIRQHMWLRGLEARTGDARLDDYRHFPAAAVRTFNTLSRQSLAFTQRARGWLDAQVARGAAPEFRTVSGRTAVTLPVLDEAGRRVGDFDIHLVQGRGAADPNNLRLLRGYLDLIEDAITTRRRRLAPYLRDEP